MPPDRQLLANLIARYGLRSREPLRRDAGRSLSLLVQSPTPAAAQQDNWLPAPLDAPSAHPWSGPAAEPGPLADASAMPQTKRLRIS